MGSANAKSGKRAGRKTLAAAIAAKGVKETKQVFAGLDAEKRSVDPEQLFPNVGQWTEREVRQAYIQGIAEGRDQGRQQGKNEARELPSESLVQVIELLRILHDGRKIECISSADLCIFIDEHGEAVDEAAALCAAMPIVKRVLERKP